MTPSSIEQCILEEGLEDLIPLPEIVQTVVTRGFASSKSVVDEVAATLGVLLRGGMIQIWSGHWSEEPEFVPSSQAAVLLADAERYRFNTPSDLERRVYYVNVDNLRVDEGEDPFGD